MKAKKRVENSKGNGKANVGRKSFKNGKKSNGGPPEKNNTSQRKQSKNKKKGQWNLVPIEEEFITDKEFENLVSFEELLDYDVVSNEDGTKEIQSNCNDKSQSNSEWNQKKRKVHDEDEDEEKAIRSVPENVNTTKTKKRKQSKNKIGLQLDTTETSDGEVINTSAGPIVIEEDEALVITSNDTSSPQLKTAKKNKGDKMSEKSKQVKPKKAAAVSHKTSSPASVNNNQECVNDVDNVDFDLEIWSKLGVPDIILKSLKEKQFNKPTTIQVLTLPAAILGKKDVVGAAETGSGKTLAFAIPIIDGILKERSKNEVENLENGSSLTSLILTPTRELAVQIKNHFDVAAKYTDIKTVVIVGGLATQKQERLLRGKPDVVIATPGRLWELVNEGDPHLSTLNQVRYLAIDETDRMVEKGHFQELEGILNVLNRDEAYKEKRQNFIFSATLAFTHEPPERLKKKIGNKKMKKPPKKISPKEKLKQIMEMVGLRPNPKIVDITTSKGTCETLSEMQITCSQDYKDYYLYYFLIAHPGRTIVFSNSINCVRRLTNLFFLLQCGEVLPLHSEMHQKQRLRNLERFTANEKGILIATDVAARGLDIQNIQHVIHYQVPKTAESYIHRSGRTARAFKGGIAILMVEPGETTTVKNIFRSLGREEMLPAFDVNEKVFRDLKSTVEMAIKVEQFEHSVRKKLADQSWMEKAKKDMDLASSSDDSDEESGNVRQKKSLLQAKKQLDAYKKQLSQMLVNNSSLSINTATQS